MGLRFKLLAAAYLLAIVIATDKSGLFVIGGITDVFVALGSLLIFAVLALWPAANETDKVDRATLGVNWADSIQFEKVPRS